ncbi:tryptophan 2,3-dioxygenase family protein [Fulvivirgaceae bacterium BMA12]|uniref:Tryptophan 2,3-dioxygenase family protein n=1 Tax=Agaribacillus aureus TaxID=3051825 RepID=A0ABT8L7T2_9BACT|nr:tryptophan 2,3-dioxygenase family protein [Fulvivirgaceae bacterium BMA12]
MNDSDIDPKLLDQLKKLEKKYEVMGQDISSYLDGLLYADYLTYWEYVHLDTLLSLQTPKTGFADEMIFIGYHQITELYFKLILWEMKQISEEEQITEDFFMAKLQRINNYFKQLVYSYDIMVKGMERDQFLKFRMALLPASGFQSAQYRMIEICATDMINLVYWESRESLMNERDIRVLYDKIYWKKGATELATGKKTLTLRQFEEKYTSRLLRKSEAMKNNNLLKVYERYAESHGSTPQLESALREFDLNANINWPLSHYKSAVRYLQKDPDDIKATGGSNWQKYLPPRFQKIVFFPNLWTEEELNNWGKSMVLQND